MLSIASSSETVKSSEVTARSSEAPLHDQQDAALMARLQEGDVDALTVLYDRYCGVILRIGSRLLGDASEAEDLLQEVFLYLFRNNRAFNASKGRLESWLIQIAYCRALNRLKWLKRKFLDRQCICEASVQAERAAPDLNPEELAELSSWRSYLMHALESLADRQRKTIQLHIFEGYSLLEISQQTGESLPNVRHLYYRGLAGLRSRLSADGFPIRRAL
jgi:RNA polymerase sigma-70 factor, ECF subfamily